MAKFNSEIKEKLNKMYLLAQEILKATEDEYYSDKEDEMLNECQNVIDIYKNTFVY